MGEWKKISIGMVNLLSSKRLRISIERKNDKRKKEKRKQTDKQTIKR